MTDDDLTQPLDHLHLVRRAAQAATNDLHQRDNAIRDAHAHGHSWAAIARAAGLSAPGVRKIVQRASQRPVCADCQVYLDAPGVKPGHGGICGDCRAEYAQ